MVGDEQLSIAEAESIQVSLRAVEEGHVEFVHPDLVIDTLQGLWYPDGVDVLCVREEARRYAPTGPG